MIPQIAARDALASRLEGLFACESFAELFPNAVSAPAVSVGFPVNEPPFYCVVDEICDDMQPGQGASVGQMAAEFTVAVYLFARHADKAKAVATASSYAWATVMAVLADQSLGMAVDHATPSITGGGTAVDADKKYIATQLVAVSCKVWAVCPNEIKEALGEGC